MMKHLISASQLSKRDIIELVERAERMKRTGFYRYDIPLEDGWPRKSMATLFYEPSTRTRLSFESAMIKLGGTVISTEAAGQFSSAVKGESLEDTIRIVSAYVDVVILRHPDNDAAQRAAEVSLVPVINAGSGSNEHPTQALLDVQTVYQKMGGMDSLRYTFVGDLKYGRTVHSLIRLLSLFRDVQFTLVSPDDLKLPEENIKFIKEKGIKYRETNGLYEDVLRDTDVLYMTRTQQERHGSGEVSDGCILTPERLGYLGETSVIMHPLPRLKELPREIDKDRRAVYFDQAINGLYMRAAILYEVFCHV